MRIHVSKDVTRTTVHDAAIAAGAYFAGASLTEHGSRKRDHAYEVKLRGDSKRRPNFYDGSGDYAATWDQWGVFLAHVFEADPDAVCGSYDGADDYHAKTNGRFESLRMPADAHGDHVFRYAGVRYSQECTRCSAMFTWSPVS